MKKFLLMTLACLLFACSASANSWGLRGGVYDIVSADDCYEDYTGVADDGNKDIGNRRVNHAILENRYHSVLIAAWRENKKWETFAVSTTAVYQPDDERGQYPNNPALNHTTDGFTLSYGDSELYTFVWDGDYFLDRVDYFADPDLSYSNCLVSTYGGYLFWQSGPADTFLPIGEALWESDGIPLQMFNIEQMPRTLMEVRNINMTSDALLEGDELLIRDVWAGSSKGKTLPVYSAPDKNSYRAANGKAAVSLKGEVDILAVQDGWTLIQYEVSNRTSRIGWVETVIGEGGENQFAATPLVSAADTFLTDDPFVSQFEQVQIPKGTELTGLAQCGEFYAYVEYRADKLCRGFVPLKDLRPTYDRAWGVDAKTADVRWDVMDALCGKWYVPGFGNSVQIFYTDGTWVRRDNGEVLFSGNYRIFDREDGAYDLIMRTEANEDGWYHLTLNSDATITLTTTEGVQTLTRDEYSSYGNG